MFPDKFIKERARKNKRNCEKKETYKDKKSAHDRADFHYRCNKTVLVPYLCPVCMQYHLTKG